MKRPPAKAAFCLPGSAGDALEVEHQAGREANIVLALVDEVRSDVVELADAQADVVADLPVEAAAESVGRRRLRANEVARVVARATERVDEQAGAAGRQPKLRAEQEVVQVAAAGEDFAVMSAEVGGDAEVAIDIARQRGVPAVRVGAIEVGEVADRCRPVEAEE